MKWKCQNCITSKFSQMKFKNGEKFLRRIWTAIINKVTKIGIEREIMLQDIGLYNRATYFWVKSANLFTLKKLRFLFFAKQCIIRGSDFRPQNTNQTFGLCDWRSLF